MFVKKPVMPHTFLCPTTKLGVLHPPLNCVCFNVLGCTSSLTDIRNASSTSSAFSFNSCKLKSLTAATTGMMAAVCGGVMRVPDPQTFNRFRVKPTSSSVSRKAQSIKPLSSESFSPPIFIYKKEQWVGGFFTLSAVQSHYLLAQLALKSPIIKIHRCVSFGGLLPTIPDCLTFYVWYLMLSRSV